MGQLNTIHNSLGCLTAQGEFYHTRYLNLAYPTSLYLVPLIILDQVGTRF